MEIKHQITHYFQPTNFTCGHATLSMALSHFGFEVPPENLLSEVNSFKDEHGQVCGGLTTWMCSAALRRNFKVELFCADSELLDLSWAKLDSQEIIERMKLAKEARTLQALNRATIHAYLDSYIEFIELGGKLTILPYISSALLDELLTRGPLMVTFAYSTLYGIGRTRSTGLRQSVTDDMRGTTCTHGAVIYGRNERGEYLVADPYIPSGFHVAPRDAMVAAIAAAAYACESHVALLTPKSGG
jgi:hypothetical protein